MLKLRILHKRDVFGKWFNTMLADVSWIPITYMATTMQRMKKDQNVTGSIKIQMANGYRKLYPNECEGKSDLELVDYLFEKIESL